MKKNGIIVVLLVLVVGMGASFIYTSTMRRTQQQNQEVQQKTIRKLEIQNERLQQKLQQKQAKNSSTSDHHKSVVPSKEPQQEGQQTLEKVVKDLYTNLYTYDPQSYTQREDSVKQDLSPELHARLFQKNPNVGDSHSVTCRADDVAIYAGQTQGGTISGVVIVTYHVRQGQGDDLKNKDIYQFQFDQKKKIVTDQTLVTSGITEPEND